MLTALLILLVGAIVTYITRYIRTSSHSENLDNTGLIGETGQAEDTFTTEGMVMIRGELWKATSSHGIIERGAKVKVVGLKPELTLVVEPLK